MSRSFSARSYAILQRLNKESGDDLRAGLIAGLSGDITPEIRIRVVISMGLFQPSHGSFAG
jgi:hypothetical protein